MNMQHNAEAEAVLDDLLIRWWAWRAPIQPARGYGNTAHGFSSYRTSRQYDDWNGALDDDLGDSQMASVSQAVDEMDSTLRAVIFFHARALSVGYTVISSPRLPSGGPELDHLIHAARADLVKRLMDAGAM